ncbi:MAG: DUF4249 domain-containing protein [Bacteroidales bacterium]|jgi:hypothetical protein|nr:DUF4249 domain-containing protein [Bacteroidales bacterium]
MKRLYWIFLLPFILSSCIQEVNIGEEFTSPKLVLYGRICPQLDTTFVKLSFSCQLLANSSDANGISIKNEKIEMSRDNRNWLRLDYDEETFRYFIAHDAMPIREGQTYYIRASADGFETVYAECTVPYKRDVGLSVRFDTAYIDYDWKTYTYEFSFQDFPNEDNYYALLQRKGEYTYDYNEDGEGYWDTIFHEHFDFLYNYVDPEPVYSDKERDGSRIKMKVDFIAEGGYYYEGKEVKVYLAQIDEHEYKYEYSRSNQNEYIGFFMEPSSVYNNIKNGFGLFSAFTLEERVIYLGE